MTPANVADLQQLWSHLAVWEEKAKACSEAEVTVALSIRPGGAGASATLRLHSSKTGVHAVHEPIDYVEEIEQALKRFHAHFEGFMERQASKEVNAASLTWGVKLANFKAPAIWGCRAILDQRGTKPFVDVLWDRQGFIGASDKAKMLLQNRLNGWDGKPGALQAFCDAVADGRIEDSETDDCTCVIGGVEFWYRMASGYVYISARLTDAADTVPPAKKRKGRK